MYNAIIPIEQEVYVDYIDRILSVRNNVKDDQNYMEKHHIVPKTLSGSNEKNNLIYLYAEEHYYAHKLLALENPDERGLQLAWWNMCQCTQNGERKYDITAEDYAEARKRAAEIARINRTGKHNSKKRRYGIPVVNITTGQEYKDAKDAEECTGISLRKIRKCCTGEVASAGYSEDFVPYVWRNKGEEHLDLGKNITHLYLDVECIETGQVFSSIREAYAATGIARTTILADCKGSRSRKKIKRLHFKFKDSK